ncbi:bestrophin-like domain [Pararhizobium haloflavum]|uniref:bestrophin-like domain n=1 Tax=Pararhizobium haloflavum TaxID=2037914 RepID=UPI000C1833CB|nr:DUF4239 domain-containing protein [Pararhizobium haloflavum]
MLTLVLSAVVGLLFATLAVALVLGSYSIARHFLHSGDAADRTHDVVGAVATRIAALHGLMLALVYAQELDDYKGIRNLLTEESVAVSDVYNDIRRYGGEAVDVVQGDLARYLDVVVDEEWDMLGRREGLSPTAWGLWQGVYEALLDLTPETDRQSFLAGRMRDRITQVARYRQMRDATAIGGFGSMFWAPALIGISLLSVSLYVYRPTRSHLVLMSIFGAYSGVILFFIYAFANPFEQPGRLEPEAFQQLLKGEIGTRLEEPVRN